MIATTLVLLYALPILLIIFLISIENKHLKTGDSDYQITRGDVIKMTAVTIIPILNIITVCALLLMMFELYYKAKFTQWLDKPLFKEKK